MKRDLLFIHGYGSDRTSRKYQELKAYFEEYNCHCLEWVVFSDIPYLLHLAVQKCMNIKRLVIVGDSTGANLAYQLRELRSQENDKLILLSPLLDLSKRKSTIAFPEAFERHLVTITNPENSLVVASKDDEVIDQQPLFDERHKKFTLLEVADGHRLKKFSDYLPAIADYLQADEKK